MRQELLPPGSVKDKAARIASSAIIAFSLNVPHEIIDIMCDASLNSSSIELRHAPDLGFSFNAQRIQKYIDEEHLQMTPVEMLDDMLSLDPALEYVRIATPMNQPVAELLEEFDEQMQVIRKHNRKAYPVIGQYQIHYPVKFPPQESLGSTQNESIVRYAQALIPLLNKYSDEISGIQLSNEPFNTFPFSPEITPENEDLIATIRDTLEPLGKKFLVTFFVDENNIDTEAFYKVLKFADIVGLDLYPEKASCSNYIALTEFYDSLAQERGKRVIVAEMQTRRWDYEKRYTTFPITDSYRRSLAINPEEVLLWNLEIPYVMDVVQDNHKPLDAIKGIIAANNAARRN